VENEFGVLLQKLRGKLSLRSAAEKVGISHTYLRSLENGEKTKPSLETLQRFSDAYSYPYNDLMEKAGYISKTEVIKLATIGAQFANRARTESLLTDSFLDSFEKELNRLVTLNYLIGSAELDGKDKLLYVDEMQGTLNNTIYSINRIHY
jgi:transcriptional regulator with XRE-family HTH domain